ncbi:MAG: VWA domain-containing protein [Planctomycetes bacterium]|nr:VWA domain-containing protein [Planctomycetota bacterium]
MDAAFPFELTRPHFLAGLAVVLVLVWFFRRSLLVDWPWRQRLVSLLVRTLIVLLLVLSLAGLTLLRPTHEVFVVFVVDQSTSVGEQSRQKVDQFIRKAVEQAQGDRYALLPFSANPGTVRLGGEEFDETIGANRLSRTAPASKPPVNDLAAGNASSENAAGAAGNGSEADRDGTDIESALEVAMAAIPPHYVPRIVLLSDGNQTEGDVLKAAMAGRVPIFSVPLPTRTDPEIQVSAVTVPAQVAQGEPFYVEVVIDANHDDQVQVEVYRGPHRILRETKKVKKGENRFRFRQSIDRDRLAEFAVRVSGGKDTLLDNNTASGLVFAAGKPRVLLIESNPEQARHLVWALEEQGILVDTRPPQGMPDSLADLQNYEALIISNVPATALSTRKMDVIRAYVSDLGGGLIMLGGDQSFGLGGYYKSVLEEVLPVRSDFEKEKEQPSLAMVLVIDKSGSMGGMKIELAKDAAKAAVELLGSRDQIGVIAFEGSTFWISELAPVVDKRMAMDRISSLQAGGGTNMYPAMEEAYHALRKTAAKLKHVIILTDGISAPGDFEGITQAMAAERITVSTVAIGQGADLNLLEEIARIGRGRYYFTDDPMAIPQIFAKETMTASKSAINERPFVPQVIRPTPALAGIDLEAAPFLLGYVVTRPKPTSEVILATERGDPLLAWWRYGLGMSVAFTSDAKSRWAAEWLTWSGFGPFWAQIVRHAMRKSETRGFVVQIERKGRQATIRLDAVDPSGRYLNGADTELTVIDPHLKKTTTRLLQVAPGRYQAQIEVPESGAYHLELTQSLRGQVVHRQSRGFVVGYPDELRLRPTNEKLLRRLAQVSGGWYAPRPQDVFAPSERTVARATPLWPYLIVAALLLFVLDVALRRIDFSLLRSQSPRGRSSGTSLVSRRVAEQPVTAKP